MAYGACEKTKKQPGIISVEKRKPAVIDDAQPSSAHAERDRKKREAYVRYEK